MFYLQPVAYAEPANLLTGWGWTDTFGWISLNCVNVYAGENNAQLISHCADNNGTDYGVSLNAKTGEMGGDAWSTNVGWIDFSPTIGAASIGSLPTVAGGDDFPYTVEMDPNTGYLSGWAIATFNDTDPNNNAWIRFRAGVDCVTGPPEAITQDNYCVRLNENGYLAGWAWSGGEDGLGWIRFEQTFSGGPYVQTKYGDVYSERSITGSRAPEGAYNATYCIVAGTGTSDDITLSSSKACLLGSVSIEFPDSAQQYATSIVNIDLDNLSDTSKVDSEFHYIAGDTYDVRGDLNPNSTLDDKVYYFTGKDPNNPNNDHVVVFRIDNDLMFDNGSLGAGTVVIDGDFYINSDITYGISSASTTNGIASVAWIVLGDVIIAPTVSDVVGTFIVLGDGTADSGRLYTGDDTASPNKLTLKGVVVAKQISLQRTFFEGLAAAEIFEYDGRVLLNTPPGLGNFAGYLPEWSR